MTDDLRAVIVNVAGTEDLDDATITIAEAAYNHAIGTNAVADYLLQSAHMEGYDDGYTDGYDAGYEDGTVEIYRGPNIYRSRGDA